MYFGHNTYLDKSLFGGMDLPIPNERAFLENKWAWVAAKDLFPFDDFLVDDGALAGTFDDPLAPALVFDDEEEALPDMAD